jgi:hypothetical protein
MPGANAPYTGVPGAGCGVIEPGASSTLVPVMSGKMVTHSSGCSHWISPTHKHRIVPRVGTFCLHVTWSVSLRRPMQVKRAASSGVQWYQSPVGVVPRKSTLETTRRRVGSLYSAVSLLLDGRSGRSHSETKAGCMVSLTTPTRSSLNASKSVSSRSWAEKTSRVLAA